MRLKVITVDLKEVLKKRRSIRKFTDDSISDELIDELLHAGMSGPSACNRQPWEFYVIKNPEMLVKIRRTSRFTNMEAKLAIVVCGNLDKALPNSMKDYWIQDCSAATQNILLRVTDLGLGAVWCGAHPQKNVEKKIKEILDLSDKLVPLNIIFIGHPNQEVEPRTQLEEKKIHYVK